MELLQDALAAAVGVAGAERATSTWRWLDVEGGALLERGVGLVVEEDAERLRIHARQGRGAPGPWSGLLRVPLQVTHLPRGALRARVATWAGGVGELREALRVTVEARGFGPVEVRTFVSEDPGAPRPLAVELVVHRPGDRWPALRRALRAFSLDEGAVSARSVLRAAGRARDRGGRGIPLDPMADAGDGLRHALRPLVEAMADELTLCAGPQPDPEHLHQARVALRAVRALLGLLGETLALPAGRLRRLRRRLQRLQADTGRPRDLDVQREAWAADPEAPPALLRWVHDAREAAAAELDAFLASGDAARALRRLRRAIRARDDRRPAGAPIALVVRGAVFSAWTSVLEEGRAITPASPADDLHDLRKTCKKLRYLLETFQRILPEGDGQAAVRDLKGLQTLLGEFQDLHVALDLVGEARAALGGSEEEGTVLDAYVAALDGRISAVRERFHEAFARFDTPAGARRLREVVGTGARAP